MKLLQLIMITALSPFFLCINLNASMVTFSPTDCIAELTQFCGKLHAEFFPEFKQQQIETWQREKPIEKPTQPSTFAQECKRNEVLVLEHIIATKQAATKEQEEKEASDKTLQEDKKLKLEMEARTKLLAEKEKITERLERENKRLKQAIAQQKKQKEESLRTQPTPKQKLQTQKDIWKALGVHSREQFIFVLADKCTDIFEGYASNRKHTSPYFDKNTHLLLGESPAKNKNWSYVFCPCNGKTDFINQSFSFIMAHPESIPTAFVCSSECQYFKIHCKCEKKACDTDSTSDAGSESDSDSSLETESTEEQSA